MKDKIHKQFDEKFLLAFTDEAGLALRDEIKTFMDQAITDVLREFIETRDFGRETPLRDIQNTYITDKAKELGYPITE